MTQSSVSQKNLGALLRALWQIFIGAFRIFAWDSLKGGFIDLRRFGRVTRLIAIVGLALVFGFIASILYNDLLRHSGTLELLPLSSSAARGIFVPTTAVPLTLIALILAWSLILTSALHIQRFVRWGIFAAFIFFGLPADFVGALTSATGENLLLLLVIVALVFLCLLVLFLAFVIFPRLERGVALEFITVLAGVGGLFVVMLFTAVEATNLGGVNFVNGYLTAEAVTNPRNLIVPLIYLSGAEIVSFGVAFTGWGAQSTARYARSWMIGVLLAVFLVYRWWSVLTEQILPGISPAQYLAWAGAALGTACLIPIALWRQRKPFGDVVSFKTTLGLILFLIVPQMILFLLVLVVSAFFLTQASDPQVIENMTAATAPLLTMSDLLRDLLYLFLTGAGIFIAVRGVRRQKFTVAAFGMILAWTQFVYWLTENGRWLQAWRYRYQDVDLWLLIGWTGLAVYWTARRELTGDRALKLLALAFFAWMLHFTDFLDNPLSLFFGIAGISYTAFGILWGVLTAGGRWQVNGDSPRFPNQSRVLMAIGYVLLTLTISHWFLVTHNLVERTFNDDVTFTGLRVLGYTAAYVVMVEGGRVLLKKSDKDD